MIFLQIKHCYCTILHNRVTSVYVNVLSLKNAENRGENLKLMYWSYRQKPPKTAFSFSFLLKMVRSNKSTPQKKTLFDFFKSPKKGIDLDSLK